VSTTFTTGLAASARSTAAVQRIYEIKRRQESAPLAICVGDVHDVSAYGYVSHLPAGLLSRLLPGPVTVVLPRRADAPLSPELNAGTSTIGACSPQLRSCTICLLPSAYLPCVESQVSSVAQ